MKLKDLIVFLQKLDQEKEIEHIYFDSQIPIGNNYIKLGEYNEDEENFGFEIHDIK